MKRETPPDAELGATTPASGQRAEMPEPFATAGLVHRPSGVHVLADLSGIAADKLNDCGALEHLLRAAAEAAHAHVLFSHFHGFGEGLGVTGVVLLAESHITIHTWPECGFAAADIFMCGSSDPQLALTVIERALQPRATHIHTAKRAPPHGNPTGAC